VRCIGAGVKASLAVFFEGLIIVEVRVCEVCGVNDEDIEYVWGVEIPTVSLQPCDRMRIRRRSACLSWLRLTVGADTNDLKTALMGMVDGTRREQGRASDAR
jgi:hypothetical protein